MFVERPGTVRVQVEGAEASTFQLLLVMASGQNTWLDFTLRKEFGEWRITSMTSTQGVN